MLLSFSCLLCQDVIKFTKFIHHIQIKHNVSSNSVLLLKLNALGENVLEQFINEKDKRAPNSLINLLNNHDQQLDNYKIKENEIS